MNDDDIFVEKVLPKALKKNEFREYIKKSQSGDLKARDKVIICNIKLVLNTVLKHFNKTPYEKKELVSVGIIGLINAVDTFDITKNIEFATYACACIKNEILMFMRKSKKYLSEKSLNEIINNGEDGIDIKIEDIIEDNHDFEEEFLKQESLLEVRKLLDTLEYYQREIIKLYFGFYNNKQYTQKEIGDIMGISRSYVSGIIIKTKKMLKTTYLNKSN